MTHCQPALLPHDPHGIHTGFSDPYKNCRQLRAPSLATKAVGQSNWICHGMSDACPPSPPNAGTQTNTLWLKEGPGEDTSQQAHALTPLFTL